MKDNLSVAQLQNKCVDLKKEVVTMIYKAQSGHPGGSLSVADFITACYFREMDVDPENPRWPERDRFVLSKGHVCPAQYAALAMKGFFDMSVLDTLRREGSPLQGHPDMKKCPGIDISTGSLGQGLACAVGMALAAKMDHKGYRVYAAVGDGECQEGEIWEAAQTANKYGLDNLVVFVDNNNLQLDGTCDEVMPNIDLGKKFAAFGFDAYEIDGNDMAQMVAALELARAVKNGRPKCIFGHTVKGNGVSFMENQCGWHGVAPNEAQYQQAIDELDKQYVAC
ncbi:MAG: transketolase [Clostridia bacterium]|nr:transketolase [Clostridia bacterium]